MTLPHVPYVAQRGNTPRNDCGPACCLMLARWLGRAANVSVADWSRKYDAEDNGTTNATLQTILRVEVGLTPISGTVAYPYIQLVDYASLPVANRSDKTGRTFLHWIVRLSDTTYHDPYWWTDRGANLSATKAQLDAARRYSGGPPVSITERPTEMASNGEPRVQYGRVVNVLPADATLERSIEVLRGVFAAKQTIGYSYDDAGIGNLADRTAVLWDIPPGNRAAFSEFFATYYPGVKVAFKSDATPLPPDPIPPTPATHPAFEPLPRNLAISGMHTINWIEDARTAADMGCRVITVLDNLSGAREMRDRGCVVIHRTWFNDPGWTPEMCVDRLGVNADDRLIVVGQNECDAGRCPGDTQKLRERFEWDRRFAELIWQRAPKCFPAIGGFSVGTPMIDNPEYARAFRETYGAFCNANAHRVGINWHLYVWRRVTSEWPPQGEEIFPDQRWWAARAKAFGYDVHYGGLNDNVISVSDEIGTESGHGGMNWAGFTGADALRWWDYWSGLYAGFPQLKYATVFIGCRSESWKGYDVRYLWPGAFRQMWGNPATRDVIDAQSLTAYEGGDADALGRAIFEARRNQQADQADQAER